MAETSRILTALGLVAASVGLTVYGIGVAFVETADFERNLGLWLMIVGSIAAVIGIVMSRQIPEEE
jgi:drug/metabolite transporter (DMT)-like permease